MEDGFFPHHSTHRDNQDPATNPQPISTDGRPTLDSETLDVFVIILVLGAAAWIGYQFVKLVLERCRNDDEDGQPANQQPDSSTAYPIFRL